MKFLLFAILHLLHFLGYLLMFAISIGISIICFLWSFEIKNVSELNLWDLHRRRADGKIVILSPFINSAYKTPIHIMFGKTTIMPL